ncbi:MAG: DnaJ domain-containing protein [Proteobacteria bacterium]|nr:DnaJ domain-containing protein [Pseudomonadota bacterium]
MKFKDYYETLGVARDAAQDDIKSAYRKLARKYHPDVSKEANAEERFKEIGEAYEVLKDPEKRAAYDRVGQGRHAGEDFRPPPGWDEGFEFSGAPPGDGEAYGGFGDHLNSDFFEALFGRAARAGAGRRAQAPMQGQDHHAKVLIDLEDSYRGAERSIMLQMPALDPSGHVTVQERRLDVRIPKGIRAGQHLRLTGQGSPGTHGAPAGDLYLEIEFKPHALYRVDGRDVYLDLPVTPSEAALGASVPTPTPEGTVELTIPAGSSAGRRLRLKGRGLPGATPGDFYAVLKLELPPAAGSDAVRDAYQALAKASAGFDPRAHLPR